MHAFVRFFAHACHFVFAFTKRYLPQSVTAPVASASVYDLRYRYVLQSAFSGKVAMSSLHTQFPFDELILRDVAGLPRDSLSWDYSLLLADPQVAACFTAKGWIVRSEWGRFVIAAEGRNELLRRGYQIASPVAEMVTAAINTSPISGYAPTKTQTLAHAADPTSAA